MDIRSLTGYGPLGRKQSEVAQQLKQPRQTLDFSALWDEPPQPPTWHAVIYKTCIFSEASWEI